jgi:hypothetical protein
VHLGIDFRSLPFLEEVRERLAFERLVSFWLTYVNSKLTLIAATYANPLGKDSLMAKLTTNRRNALPMKGFVGPGRSLSRWTRRREQRMQRLAHSASSKGRSQPVRQVEDREGWAQCTSCVERVCFVSLSIPASLGERFSTLVIDFNSRTVNASRQMCDI